LIVVHLPNPTVGRLGAADPIRQNNKRHTSNPQTVFMLSR
jgi:hypothetical protein